MQPPAGIRPKSRNPATDKFSLDPRLIATAIKAPHGARVLEISWADGHRHALPHEVLRGYCPCAGCQGHSGSIRFQEGGNLELRELSPVGNYALGFKWGDGHDAGLYTFSYLRALGGLLETHGTQGLIELGELPRV